MAYGVAAHTYRSAYVYLQPSPLYPIFLLFFFFLHLFLLKPPWCFPLFTYGSFPKHPTVSICDPEMLSFHGTPAITWYLLPFLPACSL